ncbi:hypothetical protein K0M31_011741 [Melipona bicolor]|uniref:Uncharacterized protein n=1 Tax=Melipona bicolor TaxID=60889 RepID=A0AA40KV64_9HYME|nr:hypothetical protein K0M31_011741 [Melipona bicolor]
MLFSKSLDCLDINKISKEDDKIGHFDHFGSSSVNSTGELASLSKIVSTRKSENVFRLSEEQRTLCLKPHAN